MADIRCPMCGKPNPEEADTCWSCQARLKPLISPQPPTPGNESGAPDWLSGLRGGSDNTSGWQEDSSDAEPGGDAPDWLSRIRQQQSQETAGEQEPDWLKAISGDQPETPAGETPAPFSPSEEETAAPDWLGALRSEEPAQPTAAEPPAESPAGDQQEESDWMAGLSAWSTPVSEESSENQPAAPQHPEQDADDQSWLNAFQTPAETPSEETAQPAEENLDWLSTLGLSSETPAAAQESKTAGEPPAQPAEDNLDWLSAFGAGSEPPAGEPLTPAQPADGSLDWLSQLETGAEPAGPVSGQVTPETTPPAETPSGSEEEDWLSKLPSQQTPEQSYTSAEGELSDWFGGLNIPEEESGKQATPPSPQEPAAPLDTPFGAAPAGSSPFMSEEPPAQPGETPDWLKVFGEQPAAPGADEEPPAEPAETPDWLKAFGDQPSAQTPAPDESASPMLPFAASDMPEWLGPGEETAAPAEKPAEEAAQSNLEEAQLPGWLEAMRPVEAVAPVDTPAGGQDQTIVRAGPLAGMVGILPGEEVVSKVRRMPAYSAKLHVSENQRLQATLLEQMLSEEARPRPARAERSHVPERIIRLLIALLLLLVTGLPLAVGTAIMPLPDLFPPETVNFRAQVEALPENAPVLVAVDYEPGLSEEMSLASASVVDHLISKKARLALLSTAPTGPVLADDLLRSAAVRNSAFQPAETSVNLGFLPGGTAGLQEFAGRPQVALQYQLNGKTAWDQPALEGVTNIQKFALVIVMTENAETARAWIEQVQPRLGQVPLLFVISAQSAPFIHPYIDSGQVGGMVAGMSGGITYARIARQPAAATLFWDSYQFGLFAAVLLILLGALWQLLRLLSRKPEQKGA